VGERLGDRGAGVRVREGVRMMMRRTKLSEEGSGDEICEHLDESEL